MRKRKPDTAELGKAGCQAVDDTLGDIQVRLCVSVRHD